MNLSQNGLVVVISDSISAETRWGIQNIADDQCFDFFAPVLVKAALREIGMCMNPEGCIVVFNVSALHGQSDDDNQEVFARDKKMFMENLTKLGVPLEQVLDVDSLGEGKVLEQTFDLAHRIVRMRPCDSFQ